MLKNSEQPDKLESFISTSYFKLFCFCLFADKYNKQQKYILLGVNLITPRLVTLFKKREIWILLYFLAIGIYIYLIAKFVESLAERLGFISIGIAIISILLVIRSDELIKTIANSEFRRITGQIEDIRFDLQDVQKYLDIKTGEVKENAKIFYKSQISTWKCQTYVDSAIDILLKSDIKPNSVSRFLNLINNFVIIFHYVRNILSVEAVINIFSIYEAIYSLEYHFTERDLKSFKFESRRNDSINIIKNLIDIGPDVKIDLDFLTTYKVILETFVYEGTTQEERKNRRWDLPFSSIRDMFNLQF